MDRVSIDHRTGKACTEVGQTCINLYKVGDRKQLYKVGDRKQRKHRGGLKMPLSDWGSTQ